MTNHPNRSKTAQEGRRRFGVLFAYIFPGLDSAGSWPVSRAWRDLQDLEPANRQRFLDELERVYNSKRILEGADQ
jgi:hypothetical protein